VPGAPFDAALSRFGVMFFSDPVAAFANLRAQLRPGARVTLAAWGPAAENPWFRVPARIASAGERMATGSPFTRISPESAS